MFSLLRGTSGNLASTKSEREGGGMGVTGKNYAGGEDGGEKNKMKSRGMRQSDGFVPLH